MNDPNPNNSDSTSDPKPPPIDPTIEQHHGDSKKPKPTTTAPRHKHENSINRCLRRGRAAWRTTKFHDRLGVIFEGVGLIALVIYTIFTAFMYCANKEAADAAKNAADASVRANVISAKALEDQTRPWLAPEEGSINITSHDIPARDTMTNGSIPLSINFDIRIRDYGPSAGVFLEPRFELSDAAKPAYYVRLAANLCGGSPSESIAQYGFGSFPGEDGANMQHIYAKWEPYWTGNDPSHVRRPYVAVGCITYRGAGPTIYYTEAAYRLIYASDDQSEWNKYFYITTFDLIWARPYNP